MSAQPDRRVHTLRLRAPNQNMVQRGVILLEDALHTATLPAASGGRLLIVRSLAIGAIDSRRSPSALALVIEQRLQQLSLVAVHAEDPAAPYQPAVYFADQVEAITCLALRLARNQPTSAWFWPLAVAAWQPAMPRDQALRVLLAAVLRTPSGVAALVRMVQVLHTHGVCHNLLDILQAAEAATLLQVCGWSRPEPIETPGSDILPQPWAATIQFWITRWGRDDLRLYWLAAIALAAEKPTRLLDQWLMQRAGQLIVALDAPALRVKSGAPSEPIAPALRRSIADTSVSAPNKALSANPAPANDVAQITPTGRLPTNYAGLFFILPLLAHLDIAAFLAQHPAYLEIDLAGRLLQRIGTALGIAEGDPVLNALAITADTPPHYSFVAPPGWNHLARAGTPILQRNRAHVGARRLSDASGRLPLALWHGRIPNEVRQMIRSEHDPSIPAFQRGPAYAELEQAVLLRAWHTAARRWCRRNAGLGLHNLVCRPGHITASPTHIDIFLEYRHADIRVRKAGLDLDPGWIPWFARVVLFHYQD